MFFSFLDTFASLQLFNVLVKMHSLALFSLLSVAFALPQPELADLFKRRSEASIHAAFKAAGKLYFGTCGDQGSLSSATNAEVIKADFGQITPENR